MSESKKVRIFNWVMGLLFLILLGLRLYMGGHMNEWYRHYATLWPTVYSYFVAPLLQLCTGYTLMFGLFNLLRAKIEVVENWFTKGVRWVMVAVTAALALLMLLMAVTLIGNVVFVWERPEVWPFNSALFYNMYLFCVARWFWVMLGVYWCVSLNAIRLPELLPQQD